MIARFNLIASTSALLFLCPDPTATLSARNRGMTSTDRAEEWRRREGEQHNAQHSGLTHGVGPPCVSGLA